VVDRRNPLLFAIAVANARKACAGDPPFRLEISGQLTKHNRLDLLRQICAD
jgi:hypothetical protein